MAENDVQQEENKETGNKSFVSLLTDKVKPSRAPRARRMDLSLTHVNVWSAAKVSFMLSLAGGIIQIIGVAFIWVFLNAVGVFDQLTQIVSSTGLDTNGFNLNQVLSLGTVLSGVTLFSIFEIVMLTILATIVTAIYNVIASLVGGLHITLGDD
ncbi:MAG: DUF3566 domain-containing protein [Bifidobacteriaceae bacterium]|nr:DUF3566 domain-containing protein [Bifidobacteriaceae bacterium]